METTTTQPNQCAHHGRSAITQCGADSAHRWCADCDPAPAALCHWCHGRGYSTAPLSYYSGPSDIDFGAVFRVTADGRLMHHSGRPWAPDVFHSETDDVEICGAGWSALRGYTRQYSYSGAVMHPSEYLGERSALWRDILAAPGLYTLAVVECHPDDDDPDDSDPEPAGWAVLRWDGADPEPSA